MTALLWVLAVVLCGLPSLAAMAIGAAQHLVSGATFTVFVVLYAIGALAAVALVGRA